MRNFRCFVATGVSIVSLTSAVIAAEPVATTPAITEKPVKAVFKLPSSKTKLPDRPIIDMIGKEVVVESEAEMSIRFRDGPRVPPKEVILLDGPRLAAWNRSMSEYLGGFITYYDSLKKGPTPDLRNIPIYIVQDDEINCMIVREDSDKPEKSQNTSLLGFLGGTETNKTQKTKIEPASPDPGDTLPARLEMRCTSAALTQIGKVNPDGSTGSGREEIAFIIAHEYGHIILGHMRAYEKAAKDQKNLSDFFVVGTTALTLATSEYRRSGNQINIRPTTSTSRNVTRLMVAAFLIDEYNIAVKGPKWKRDQEQTADFLAVDLMRAVNIAPAHAVSVLRKFDEASRRAREKGPNFSEQLAVLLAIGAFEDANKGKSADSILRSTGLKAVVFSYLKWREGAIGHTHDKADVRSVAIKDYDAKFYKKPPPMPGVAATEVRYPDPVKMAGEDIWDGKAFEEAAKAQIQARKLVSELASGCDTLTADSQAFIDGFDYKSGKAISRSQIENYAMGIYLVCKSDWKAAVPFLKAATSGPQHNASYYISLVQTRQLIGDFAPTMAEINEAEIKAPPRAPYIPLRVASLVGLKQMKEALTLAEQCKAEETVTIGTACMNAAGKTYEGEPLPPPDDETAAQAKSREKGFLQTLKDAAAAAAGEITGEED